MNIKIKTILLLCLVGFLLTGCIHDTSVYMQDPISLSGDTAYYAAMDLDLRSAALSQKHIALSGIVSAGGYTTLFVGDEQQDGICFSCTFSQRSDAIAALKEGDMIQLHGICTGIADNLIYLEHCQLTSSTTPAESSTSVPPATKPTDPPTTAPTTPPATNPTVPSAAPTTAPSPTPPPTVPSTAPTANEGEEDMVWIPQSGKKYHAKPSCSGMKNPTQVTKEEAQAKGYDPCKKCYS